MEWTTEKRYKKYSEWTAEELLDLQAQATKSDYQLSYHVRPQSGLLNDPNGFSYFNGEYNLFYQAFPFGAAHGLKSWFHLTSKDLVNWKNMGLAVKPDTKFDSHGAYSGSAHVIDDELFLMYTGNHRDENWERHTYQIGAKMDKNYNITKLEKPMIEKPDHVTEHFRDPQLIKFNDMYYAIIGAQDAKTKTGKISLFRSKDLKKWQDLGYVDFSNDEMGYMIECPNLVFVDEIPVLIFCPQGLDKNITNYQNIYPNMYMLGEQMRFNKAKFITNQEKPLNLDDGFDVYATQAFNSPNGKAYAISWVGLPDISYPTDAENWANCMSQVKELHVKDGVLYQQPVPAMASLRKNGTPLRVEKTLDTHQTLMQDASQNYELKLDIEANQAGELYFAANNDLSSGIKVSFSTKDDAYLTVDRSQAGIAFDQEHGETRTIKLDANQRLSIDLFVDHSLAEMFINNGKNTMTFRYFAPKENTKLAIASDGELNFTGTHWIMEK